MQGFFLNIVAVNATIPTEQIIVDSTLKNGVVVQQMLLQLRFSKLYKCHLTFYWEVYGHGRKFYWEHKTSPEHKKAQFCW